MKKNTVRVYDTISKKFLEVEVNDEVRTHYNRTQWNIDDNDESFFKHEIQFSALIGGHENAFENFKESMTDYDVEKATDCKILIERLYSCLKLLSKSERDLIIMLFLKIKQSVNVQKNYVHLSKMYIKIKSRFCANLINF